MIIVNEFGFVVESPGRMVVYPENRWEIGDYTSPRIGIDSILATQALGMQLLARKNRSVRELPGKHMFASRNNSEAENNEMFYDGTTEEYMAFMVTKIGFDQWRMRVRFRQNKLTVETRNISDIDDYRFDWLRNGNRQAWFGHAHITAYEGVTVEEWGKVHPLCEGEMIELREQMVRHHEEGLLESAWRAKSRIIGDNLE